MRTSSFLRWYFALYDVVSKERRRRQDLDTRIIHAHLTMVLSTGVLMWSYAFLAWKTFSIPWPGYVGFAASAVHLLSPLLFLVSSSATFICSVALGAGMAHQLTFAYFSGGFDSCILTWLPILPLLAGYIEGKKSLLLWTWISSVAIAIFLGLYLSGFVFPFLITQQGYHTARALLLFGWIFILFCTTWVHVSVKEYSEENLRVQGQRIDDLFRVLFHDLANSLGRINIGINLCEREQNPAPTKRGLEVIREAQGSMTEITQNVRKMYAVSKGKGDVCLSLTPLNACVEHVTSMFAPELEKKKIHLVYDREKNKRLSVLVDPVSFNNQVLGNILSNAIKFSDVGSTITVSCWPVNSHLISLEIKDTGIGMPKALVNDLFDMTKKTSRPGTQGETGTGFGMHIMKSFVDMYQGQVQIDSVEREGSLPSGTSIRLLLRGEWAP